jgi:hypothetical protein
MTTHRKFRLIVTPEICRFLEFLKGKLIEAKAGAARGDSAEAERAEFIERLVRAGQHPKGRPTLVYSRKEPMERA